MSDQTAEETVSDGRGTPGRKPDAIAREIELTRAELADTIDAIAGRISPKRAVSRGRQAVRAQMSSVTGRGQDEPTRVISLDEPAVTPSDDPAPGPVGADPVVTRPIVTSPAAPMESSGVDPRLLAAGAAAGAALVLIALRRKRG